MPHHDHDPDTLLASLPRPWAPLDGTPGAAPGLRRGKPGGSPRGQAPAHDGRMPRQPPIATAHGGLAGCAASLAFLALALVLAWCWR